MPQISFRIVEEIIKNAPPGVDENQIIAGLKRRGFDVEGLTFKERLGKSFGTREDIEETKRAEKLAGTRGRFEVGDIADVAGKALTFLGFAAGAPFGAIGAAAGAALGETARQAIGKAIGEREEFDAGEVAVEGITAGVAGGLAKVGGPILKSVFKGGKEVTKVGAAKIASPISRFFFGPKGTQAIKARFQEPELTEKFLKATRGERGGMATDDIVSLVNKSIGKMANRVRGQFVQAEGRLVNKAIPKIAFKETTKTIRQFVDDAALIENEGQVVNKMIKVLRSVKKPTTKSVLEAKRKVAKLYRGTENFKQVDALNTKVVSQLNKMIQGVDPAFRRASKLYSSEQRLLEKLGVNITGTNPVVSVEQTATKLYQLAKDLDNPLKREASERLLRQLGGRTGVDFIRLLRALNTAETLSPAAGQGLRAGIVREMVRLLEVGVSGAGARIGQLSRSIKAPIIPEAGRVGIRRAAEIGTFGAARQILNQ